MHRIIMITAALLAGDAYAATMFKCVDAKGRVTFTQANCPDNHELDDVVSHSNQTPSAQGKGVRMADPNRPKALRSGGQPYTVVEHQPRVIAPTPERQLTPQRTPLNRVNQQPCVKVVDRLYRTRVTTKKGTSGMTEMKKVVVPC